MKRAKYVSRYCPSLVRTSVRGSQSIKFFTGRLSFAGDVHRISMTGTLPMREARFTPLPQMSKANFFDPTNPVMAAPQRTPTRTLQAIFRIGCGALLHKTFPSTGPEGFSERP